MGSTTSNIGARLDFDEDGEVGVTFGGIRNTKVFQSCGYPVSVPTFVAR